eukprot:TRINITY_DN12202_c0_g1_i1.p1 TRINITY_DN12202_c0_g1~~TRINITY_DN12202_c0_g1_i1.p1  ORF type:complete len:609 (+),score=241.60 TRINITY_DN12202_c0_g1_i1:46-1872(+)
MWNYLLYAAAMVGAFAGFLALMFKPLWQRKGKNPFEKHAREDEIEPMMMDHAERDKVLKKLYTKASVKEDDKLDAVVIGSGIGGLTTAALMARAGKKVLVLEQHDVAGGCCHAFFENGYEFDTGIHYVGTCERSFIRRIVDRITDKKLGWTPLDDTYDVALVGGKSYNIVKGRKARRDELVKHFPKEEKAIDKFFETFKKTKNSGPIYLVLKTLPKWFLSILVKTGVVNLLWGEYFKYATMTLSEVMDSITDNEELKNVLGYCSGDYGNIPSEGSFAIHASVWDHFVDGAAYPTGGSSEIVMQFVKQIRKGGGDVLVKALVKEVLVENGRAVGVVMNKDGREIRAPIVISDAGFTNTYKTLCPQLSHMIDEAPTKQGPTCVCLFAGLKGGKEELGLTAQNWWSIKSDAECKAFRNMSAEEVMAGGDWELPGVFVSFPSTKDPVAQARKPDGSSCTAIAFTPYEWFEGWQSERIHSRGTDYEALKGVLTSKLWEAVLRVKPELKDKVDYMDGATPLTCKFYYNSPKGEIYGLDHDPKRFTPEAMIALRPETPIPGLFLTGQDILSAGFAGALVGGIIASGVVLERNVMLDIFAMVKEEKKKEAAAKKKE